MLEDVKDLGRTAFLVFAIVLALSLLMSLLSCASRETQLCDADVLARKAQQSIEACPGDWETCPERERLLQELREELGKCSAH